MQQSLSTAWEPQGPTIEQTRRDVERYRSLLRTQTDERWREAVSAFIQELEDSIAGAVRRPPSQIDS
ncbi:MAG TPA: hypothetical protein VIJ42_15665 [Stellaceae bacterium]